LKGKLPERKGTPERNAGSRNRWEPKEDLDDAESPKDYVPVGVKSYIRKRTGKGKSKKAQLKGWVLNE